MVEINGTISKQTRWGEQKNKKDLDKRNEL